MTNDTKLLLVVASLAVVGVVIYTSTNKKEADSDNYDDVEEEPIPSTPQVPQTTNKINRDLVLKKGSKGNEVAELQKILGVGIDGDFGSITENALFATKGVKQISLNQYPKTQNINPKPLAIGNRIMANKKPSVTVYQNKTLANGEYSNTKIVEDKYSYGEEIGKIVAITKDKMSYVVLDTDIFSPDLVWVAAADVVKI